MRFVMIAAALAGTLLLPACSSTGAREQLDDVSRSFSGGIGRNTDTYGTQRRVDVYGGSTSPTLPTIGASGFGK